MGGWYCICLHCISILYLLPAFIDCKISRPHCCIIICTRRRIGFWHDNRPGWSLDRLVIDNKPLLLRLIGGSRVQPSCAQQQCDNGGNFPPAKCNNRFIIFLVYPCCYPLLQFSNIADRGLSIS